MEGLDPRYSDLMVPSEKGAKLDLAVLLLSREVDDGDEQRSSVRIEKAAIGGQSYWINR
jgi:hypothetical protein